MTPDGLASTLLLGAIEALNGAAECLHDKMSSRDLRRGIHDLAWGAELAAKAMLASEHWALVFADANKADIDRLKSGDFRSVSYDEALDRMKSMGSALAIPANHQRWLTDLRHRRNRMEHLGVVDNEPALRSIAGKALHALAELLTRGFAEHPLLDSEEFAELLSNAQQFKSFTDARLNDVVRPRLKGKTDILECPRCQQEAARISDGLRCLFCDSSWEAEDGAVSLRPDASCCA